MELQILDAINGMHTDFFNHLFVAITTLGNGGMIWIILGIILLFQKKYRAIGIGMILSLLLTTILGEGMIKHLVCRARPFTYRPDLQLLVAKPSTYSFPSGHTGSSFACAVFLLLCNKKLGIPALVLAVLIAFSRMYVYVHFPTDILGGILLGNISAIIIFYYCYQKYFSCSLNE